MTPAGVWWWCPLVTAAPTATACGGGGVDKEWKVCMVTLGVITQTGEGLEWTAPFCGNPIIKYYH